VLLPEQVPVPVPTTVGTYQIHIPLCATRVIAKTGTVTTTGTHQIHIPLCAILLGRVPFFNLNHGYFQAVFRIRIHLIRIQKFRLNTDPDPIRIQGFDDQNLKKFTSEKRFFGSKIAIYYSLGSIKDVQATEEAFSPPKRTSSSSPFLWVFLPSNPDPKHWFQVFDDISYYCKDINVSC
jgi:hypothetical protein